MDISSNSRGHLEGEHRPEERFRFRRSDPGSRESHVSSSRLSPKRRDHHRELTIRVLSFSLSSDGSVCRMTDFVLDRTAAETLSQRVGIAGKLRDTEVCSSFSSSSISRSFICLTSLSVEFMLSTRPPPLLFPPHPSPGTSTPVSVPFHRIPGAAPDTAAADPDHLPQSAASEFLSGTVQIQQSHQESH